MTSQDKNASNKGQTQQKLGVPSDKNVSIFKETLTQKSVSNKHLGSFDLQSEPPTYLTIFSSSV
jgi:hypothetical protein